MVKWAGIEGSTIKRLYNDNILNTVICMPSVPEQEHICLLYTSVMRGIDPANIITRNGDTLEEDWPYFDENDPVNTYNPLYVDAVVSLSLIHISVYSVPSSPRCSLL